MGKNLIITVAVSACIGISNLQGQSALQQAGNQYEMGMLNESLTSYLDAEKGGNINAKSLATVASIYAQLGNTVPALEYFKKARLMSPTDYSFSYAFAQVLIQAKDYDRAKAELSFLQNDASVSHMMDYADHASKSAVDIKATTFISGDQASFSPRFVNGQLTYNSYNKPMMDANASRVVEGQKGFYTATYDDGLSQSLLKGINNRLNLGSISVAKDGTCVFTRSNPLCQSLACRMKNSAIFIGKLDKGILEDEKALSVNKLGTSNIEPFISEDGNTIYFASNREGGLGGFDIYSTKLENGVWSSPENAGSTVNTPGNEISPLMVGTDLVFASDWHLGLGGYDLFKYNGQSVEPVKGANSPDNEFSAVYADGKLYYTSTVNGKENIMMTDATFKVNTVIASAEGKSTLLKPADVASNPSAKLVSSGYTVTRATKTYYVQLAAYGMSATNFDKFKSMVKFGDVYKIFVGQAVKVRLGLFNDEVEARNALANVKKSGFPDAFVVGEIVNTANMELIFTGVNKPSTNNEVVSTPKKPTTPVAPAPSAVFASEYKVRLASYEDPIWFDNKKVKDLGTIEQWSKGTWTIFVLSGYKTAEQAEQAKIKAINRGFANAEVVVDAGGILEPIKKN